MASNPRPKIANLLSKHGDLTLNQLLVLYKEEYGTALPYTGSLKVFLTEFGFDCPNQIVLGRKETIKNIANLLKEFPFLKLNRLTLLYTTRFGPLQYDGKLKTFLIDSGFEVLDDDTVRLKSDLPTIQKNIEKIFRENPQQRSVNDILAAYKEAFGQLIYEGKLKMFLNSVGFTVDKDNKLRHLHTTQPKPRPNPKDLSNEDIKKNIATILAGKEEMNLNDFLRGYEARFGKLDYDCKLSSYLGRFGYKLSGCNISLVITKKMEKRWASVQIPQVQPPIPEESPKNTNIACNVKSLLREKNFIKLSIETLHEVYNEIFSPAIAVETLLETVSKLDCVKVLDGKMIMYGEIAPSRKKLLKTLVEKLEAGFITIDDLKMEFERAYLIPLILYGSPMLALTNEGYVCHESFVDLSKGCNVKLDTIKAKTNLSRDSSKSMFNIVESRREDPKPLVKDTSSDLFMAKIKKLLIDPDFLEYPRELLEKYEEKYQEKFAIIDEKLFLFKLLERIPMFLQSDGTGKIFMSADDLEDSAKGSGTSRTESENDGEIMNISSGVSQNLPIESHVKYFRVVDSFVDKHFSEWSPKL